MGGHSRSSAGAQRDPREAKILIGVRGSPWLSTPLPLPVAPWQPAPWPGGCQPSVLLLQLYRDAQECLTLLSQRLGSQKFFFGDS